MRLPATIVWGNGLLRSLATVIEQSATGARLQLQDDVQVTGDCYLLYSHRLEPCRLVWQASRSVGVHFLIPE